MYFKKLKTAAQLIIVVFIIAFASCKKTEHPYFLTTINKITMPDTVHVLDSFKIRLYSHIGPSRCYVLGEVNFYWIDTEGPYKIFITAFVKNNGNDCGKGESFVDDEIDYYFDIPGKYTFYDLNKKNVELGRIVVIP